jgi:hypothetical protein
MLNVHTATTVVIAMVICMLTSMVFAPAWNVIVDTIIQQIRVIHPLYEQLEGYHKWKEQTV